MSNAATPDALVQSALQLDRAGRVAEAAAAYEEILARWPELPDLWYNLAVLRRRMHQFEPALAAYQEALARGIERAEEVYLNRAVLYADYLRDDAAAERELGRALTLNPDFLPALLNLGNLHEDLGRREEARKAYERILALDPACVEALARLGNLAQPGPGARALVERLRAAVARPGVHAAERASAGFALGRLLDAEGDYAAAFDAYVEANRASRASIGPGIPPYDRAQQERWTDRLIAAPLAAPRADAAVAAEPAPIFICGMHRSGSTLIEQLLTAAPGVAAGGELELIPRLAVGELAPFPESLAAVSGERLAALASGYRAAVAGRFPGARAVTDKRPDNFFYIGLIKCLFPDARIVHTVRDPLDTCLSNYFLHLDHRMTYALDLMDTGHFFREYRRLMTHWKAHFGADIFDLDYDQLVRAPEPTLERLRGFLGLETPPAGPGETRAPVKTASVWQVREPIYQRSSGRAVHYARQLGALRAYLADEPPR